MFTPEFYAGLGIGFGSGVAILVFSVVVPMIKAFQRMRYDGFRPSEPPPRPLTVPPGPKLPNEGIN